MSGTLLKIENLKKNFASLEVLKGLSLEIRKGEVVVMIGPSGSGKSTFLRCMNLLEQPTEGAIFFNGIDIVSASEKDEESRAQRDGYGLPAFQSFPALDDSR